jgi:hypothetical protein
MHFTLSKLLIAIAMVALACAGLTIRTRGWADGIVSFTLFLYLVIGIRAVGLRGRDRAVSITFSLVGIGYILLISCNLFDLRESLATKYPLALLAKAFHVPIAVVPAADNFGLAEITDGSFEEYLQYATSFQYGDDVGSGPLSRFFLIGRFVWSWLLAWLASCLCGSMWAKRERLTTDVAHG